VRHYFEVLRTRGVARLLFSQLAARFPTGMLAIGLLIHVEQRLGNYTSAGAVLAAFGIAQGIASPLGGRLMSRFGMRGVLVPTMLVCATALAVIALVPMATWLTAVVAFVAGLTVPPVSPAVRTVYPTLARGPKLVTLFSFDATLQEIVWIIGPLATIGIGAIWDPSITVLVAAVVLLAGSVWFASAPEIGLVKIPASPRRMGAVLRNPVVVIMAIVLMLALGIWGAIDASIVAHYGHDSPITGAVLVVSAVGSFAGGLLTGNLPMRRSSLTARVLLAVVGVWFALLVAANPWLLSIALFIAGASCAPVIAVANASVSARVRFSDTAEAFGWLATALMLGSSLASALAGIVIDQVGAMGGMYVAAGFITAALMFTLATFRWHPDLRGADLEPQADTGAMPIIDLRQEI
jgi:predicted MFS family arabinose efflux permease